MSHLTPSLSKLGHQQFGNKPTHVTSRYKLKIYTGDKQELVMSTRDNQLPTSQLTIYSCSNVSTTLGGKCENVGKIKLLQHIPGKFIKSFHNVAAKSCKKTSPQHYGNINSFRQSVTIFTMSWQPFCNVGKYA